MPGGLSIWVLEAGAKSQVKPGVIVSVELWAAGILECREHQDLGEAR